MSTPDLTPDDSRLSLHRRRFTLILALVLLAVFLYMLRDVLLGAIGGIIIWAMTRGLHGGILRRVRGRRGLAAGLSMLATMLLLIVPAALLLTLMARDAASLAARAQAWFEPYQPELEASLEAVMNGQSVYILGYEITAVEITQKIEELSGQVGQFLLGALQKTAGGLARAFVLLFVMLYTLFFFYLDGPAFLEWLKRLIPLRPEQSERLFHDFIATSRATLKTVAVIGLAQGVMGGVAFWICGIPAPFFWTMLMAVASMIPAVGAQIILVPAAVLLIMVGKVGYGIGLFLWSWIVIANIDNFLRPVLVKREVNLHELLVFLSTIGGIATFGFFGVLVGPVIAALLKSSLQIYTEIYGRAEEETMSA